jgi:predicted lipoprotein with Yx(FWY)xxD motif
MTRWLTIGGSCLLLVSAIVPAARAAPAQQATPEILVANNQKYGPILVDSQQHTLYILTAETNTVIKCADKCLTFWPPLTVPAADAKPAAAAGVTGQLGTVARPDSNPQITYNGYPLYRYYQDAAPGDTNGQGTQFAGGAYTVIPATAAAITSAAQLSIASPDGWQADGRGSVTPDQADGNILVLAHVHFVLNQYGYHFSYKDAGMLFGYVEQAHRLLADGSRFQWEYIGSAYPSPKAAQSTFTALSSFYPMIKQYYSAATAETCVFAGAEQCFQASAPVLQDAAGNNQIVVIRVLQVSSSIFEAAYILPQGDFGANSASGDQLLDTLSSEYVHLFAQSPTPTPAPTATPTTTPIGIKFSIARVWWEALGTKGHADDPGVTAGQAGAAVYFAVAFHVSSAPPSLPVKVTFRLPWSSRAVTNTGALTATDPTGTYHSRVEVRLPTKPGAYVGTVVVRMGGQTRRGKAPITIPVIRPLTFSFDSLVVKDAQGVVHTTFHVNRPLAIVAGYTVRNLQAHFLKGRVSRDFKIPVHGKFQTVSSNSDSILAVNGVNPPNTHSFTPGTTGPLIIVVEIRLGNIQHRRQVRVQITR